MNSESLLHRLREIRTARSERDAELGDKSGGFSVVELIVVVLIVGVLAAVAVPIYQGIEQRSRDSATRASVRAVATYAYSSYMADGEVSLPPDVPADPDSVMVAIVYSKKNDPLSLCAIALGPKAPKPALYSGPGCDRYNWGASNPGGVG